MEAGASPPDRTVISDARAMRALAHPLRVALLEAIRRDGEITATRAAELLDESPGNMSWHLQTLARYGYVEEAGGGRGRSRPWRMTRRSETFDTSTPDPEAAAASEALERTFVERVSARMHEWWARRRDYPVSWHRAAFMSSSVRYLTMDELAEVSEQVAEIFGRHAERNENGVRPEGAIPVELFALGHPVPPTAAGN
jgi:DNA-binding transcriptional ArsR family regulator